MNKSISITIAYTYIFSVFLLLLTFKNELTVFILLQNTIFFLYISYLIFRKFIGSGLEIFSLASKITYFRLSISIIILILAISLTISSIDTLINAISSLIIVDGNKILNFKGDYLKISNHIIIILSVIAFIIASKGLSILYLFLIADLLCCSAVFTVFYSFYNKDLKERNAYISIMIGLFFGLLLFPSPDFSKSILIGFLFPISNFPVFMSQSLLFMSFLVATFSPILAWKIK